MTPTRKQVFVAVTLLAPIREELGLNLCLLIARHDWGFLWVSYLSSCIPWWRIK